MESPPGSIEAPGMFMCVSVGVSLPSHIAIIRSESHPLLQSYCNQYVIMPWDSVSV